MRQVTVLIADDHRLIVEALRATLALDERITVVGATNRGPEVLPLIGQLEPDVVLLDVRMPEMDGITCLRLIRKRHPHVKVILLSGLPEDEVVPAGNDAGAAAAIGKGIEPGLLPEVVVQVAAGEVLAPRGFPEPSLSHPKVAGLSPREQSILSALAQGQSNREIAAALHIAEQTVKFHLTNIYAKLGVPNRTGAARFAYDQGLVEAPFMGVA